MKGIKSAPGLLLLLAVMVQADMYKWVDKDGRVHFGDNPPEDAKPERLAVEVNTITMPTVTTNEFLDARENQRQAAASRQVTMYSTVRCGYCKKARRYFRQQGIPFKEYDVETSRKGRADYKKMNGRGVPIILVGNKRMNGFSADRFQKLYDEVNRR